MNVLIKKENNTSEFRQFIRDELDECESIMLSNDYSHEEQVVACDRWDVLANANRALNWFDMKNKES